jgi:hypothetical protein
MKSGNSAVSSTKRSLAMWNNARKATWLLASLLDAETIISVPQNAFGSALGSRFVGAGSFDFRAYVYAWNGGSQEAVGPALYTSAAMTYNPGTPQAVTFHPDVNLIGGHQYVFFMSTSGLQSGLENEAFIVSNSNPVYAGGTFVFLLNGNDPTQWTNTPWSGPVVNGNLDELAFTADFAPRRRSQSQVRPVRSRPGSRGRQIHGAAVY